MTTSELIARIRELFEIAVSRKTGWGKNEIMKEFDRVVSQAALEKLEERIDR